MTKLYGSSDDLFEIEGEIIAEYGCYQEDINFKCSDGTEGRFEYNGEWNATIKKQGSLFSELIKNVGDDGKHTGNAEGLTSYSDVIILNDGIKSIVVNGKKFKPV